MQQSQLTLKVLSEPQPIDLLLIDLMMPGMDLINSIQQICSTWPDVPVVVVSVREDMQIIRQTSRAGAVGYIPKTSSPDVTMNAIWPGLGVASDIRPTTGPRRPCRRAGAFSGTGGRCRGTHGAGTRPPGSRAGNSMSSTSSPKASRTRKSPSISISPPAPSRCTCREIPQGAQGQSWDRGGRALQQTETAAVIASLHTAPLAVAGATICVMLNR